MEVRRSSSKRSLIKQASAGAPCSRIRRDSLAPTGMTGPATAASIAPPYVLVGTLDAVSEIRIYNGLYSKDVSGAVFIDGNNLDAYAHHIDTPDFLNGPWQQAFGSFSSDALSAACWVIPTIQRVSYLTPKFGKPRP